MAPRARKMRGIRSGVFSRKKISLTLYGVGKKKSQKEPPKEEITYTDDNGEGFTPNLGKIIKEIFLRKTIC